MKTHQINTKIFWILILLILIYYLVFIYINSTQPLSTDFAKFYSSAVLLRQNSSIYSLTKSELFRQRKNNTDAIKILESYIQPLVRIKNYENVVYQRIGFPNNLLPTLAILEKNNYDLMIYQQLEELYLVDGRIEDAILVRRKVKELNNLLNN